MSVPLGDVRYLNQPPEASQLGDPVAVTLAGFPVEASEDIVIIEQKTEDTSKGGIVLVGESRMWPQGRVISCGPGRTYMWFMDAAGVTRAGQGIKPRVEVGDYVFLGKYQSGSEPVEIKGKRYMICRENDIMFKSVNGEVVDVKLVAPDS